jgi:hypothetical protein
MGVGNLRVQKLLQKKSYTLRKMAQLGLLDDEEIEFLNEMGIEITMNT